MTTLDTKTEVGHFLPRFLPDGQHFFDIAPGGPAGAAPDVPVYVASLGSGERKLVLRASAIVQDDQGSLIFSRGGTLMAQPFDAANLTLSGQATPLAEQVQFDAQNAGAVFTIREPASSRSRRPARREVRDSSGSIELAGGRVR